MCIPVKSVWYYYYREMITPYKFQRNDVHKTREETKNKDTPLFSNLYHDSSNTSWYECQVSKKSHWFFVLYILSVGEKKFTIGNRVLIILKFLVCREQKEQWETGNPWHCEGE